ncbi:MAG TPA: hypothetical protein P5218_09845 [Planctomycetota bacterium]|nr:hypothetical protein [Planctomycetota bacterium]HPF13610.1 hypothetical protein [Planctomycetota bacterium]HRV81728.1 hypothetical protein [Planctomycetota bacterium]
MNPECLDFRSRLSAVLADLPVAEAGSLPDVQTLGWHAHLLSCEPCRQLLESEQALEELLATLPTPQLLEGQRALLVKQLSAEVRLESLLSLADPFGAAPQGLADRVRQHVAQQAEQVPVDAALDSWLAQADHIEAPAGLSERVLAHCHAAEAPQAVSERAVLQPAAPRLLPTRSLPPSAQQPAGGRRVVLRHWFPTSLVAASLAALLWYLPGTQPPKTVDPEARTASNSSSDEADPEMLAVLDSLEVLHMVDELNSEEWELLDDYDRLGLFLMDDSETDGAATTTEQSR